MNDLANFNRADCEALDREDKIAFARSRFLLPEGVIYLDGNSLGPLPVATIARLQEAVREEWGHGLIRSWNMANWVTLPQRVGASIAGLLGAKAHEIIAADSTTVNIFKLLSGTLTQVASESSTRRVILSERDNFPTDLYVAQGLNSLLGNKFELRLIDGEIDAALDEHTAVALLTHVNYRTGYMHDMALLNRAANDTGTRILWDLSHSAGAVPLSLNENGAELAVGCGYKYLNGGPGAPAFVYVASALQSDFPTPLSGWFGHASPFAFSPEYYPAADVSRFQCGTPSVLSMIALECGVATFAGVSMNDLRRKSLLLSDLFGELMSVHCGEFGFDRISPHAHAHRGSQLSFAHPHAYPIMQAIIDRGVIGDFRQPDLLRFGFTPLYLRYADLWDAVMVLRDIMRNRAWENATYQQRHKVT